MEGNSNLEVGKTKKLMREVSLKRIECKTKKIIQNNRKKCHKREKTLKKRNKKKL